MRLLITRLLFFIYCSLPLSLANAQPVEFSEFIRLSDQLGGRQSSVYDIYRSAHDYLWFATDTDGVLRYDGYDYVPWSQQLFPSGERVSYSTLFITPDETLWAATWGHGLVNWHVNAQAPQQFMQQAEQAQSLRDDRVQTLFYDAQQRLWVGTLNGLSYLVLAENAEWQMRGLAAEHPLRNQRIWRVTETSDYLWVATSQGLYRLTPDLTTWQHYLLNPEEQGPNRQNEIRTVAVFDDEVWVGTDFGVFFFDSKQEQFQPVKYPPGHENSGQVRSNVLVSDPFASNSTTFWSGGWDGLHLIDRERKQYVRLGQQWSQLADVDVRTITFDSVGDMWIGTRDQGTFFGRRDRQGFQPTLSEAQLNALGLTEQRATYAVHYSANDDLWLGNTAGVLHQDAQTKSWQLLRFPAEDFVNQVETIYSDSLDNLWVATNMHLYRTSVIEPAKLQRYTYLHEQLELTDQAVNAILEIEQQTLLFAFWGQGVAEVSDAHGRAEWQFRQLQGLRGNQVYDMVHLEDFGYFMVTRYSGVFHQGRDDQQWQPFTVKPEDALGGDDFLCIYAQPPSILWLCSDEGVWRVNLSDNSRAQLTMKEGLPSDRVVGVHADREGYIWLLTSLGLARYDETQQSIINFGLNDGLPAEVMLRQAVDKNSKGITTVGSVQGAFSFDPAGLALNTRKPQVALTQLAVNGHDRTMQLGFSQPSITLAPDDRSLAVQYSVMDFHDTSRNSGRFRLLGASENWSDWSFSREISFVGLPAGDYVLQIEGRNSQGIHSIKPTELLIRVLQPWWQTPWAITLGLLSLVVFLYLLLRLRFRALEAANKKLDDEVKARTLELEQVNAQLRKQSETDPLTGLLNRRGFSERFELTQQQLIQRKEPMALALLDVDHFKQVNDRYGHDIGDLVLKRITQTLQERLRRQDVVARWGGEEFILLLPNTDKQSALSVCEALREAIARTLIDTPAGRLSVTVTFGVRANQSANMAFGDWLKAADAALYEGKAAGRNLVVSV